MRTGAQIILYNDNENLNFKNLSVQRILRWRLFLDQFDFQIKYIEGNKNFLADCFSRLSTMEKPLVGDREAQGKGNLINFNIFKINEMSFALRFSIPNQGFLHPRKP